MADPDVRLLLRRRNTVAQVAIADPDHYRLMREFWSDPKDFVTTMLAG
jgi:predicted ATPase